MRSDTAWSQSFAPGASGNGSHPAATAAAR